MPKTKEQKRQEAIARAAESFEVKGHIRKMSQQEYLDQFRRKADREEISENEIYLIPFYQRNCQ